MNVSGNIRPLADQVAPQQMNVSGNIRPFADQAQLQSDAIEQHLSALTHSMQIVENEKRNWQVRLRQNPIPVELNNSINHKVLNAKENRTKDVSTTSQKPTAPIPHNLTKLTSNFDKYIPNNPQKKQQSHMENNTKVFRHHDHCTNTKNGLTFEPGPFTVIQTFATRL
ncbi:hypothetical protein KY284_032541 [Solanum tuberosum]|nr:hypothetical protein KY284_032541 [Solanum tuberosum]